MSSTFMRRLVGWVCLGLLALVSVSLSVPAQAGHTVSLAGSHFEIDTNANLTVEHASPAIDWASVAESRKADKASGSGDDSFGQGSKEDTPVPSVVSGSIPPNKSDLKNFGVYLEDNANGRFLHLFWHRVQDPSGTTNMDFEFNKSSELSSNGVTPERSLGDLLLQYDLSNGGTNPQLFLSRWLPSGPGSACEASNSTPCWSDRVNLTSAGDATGSINTTAITAGNADGLGAISARTFGEATVDFDALTDDECAPFGSAYLKSRSSDSFTAAAKDFIAPLTLELDTCGSITVEKVSNGGAGSFDFTSDTLGDGTFTLTTTASGLAGADSETFVDLVPGTYDAAETVPSGWTLDNATCSDGSPVTAISLQATEDITCTFTNRGYAKVTVSKVDDDDPVNAVDGAVIRVYEDVSPFGGTGPDQNDIDAGVVASCTTSGGTCQTGSVLDSDKNYWVVEHSVPAGYFGADPQLINPTPGQNVAVTFVDPRKFKVVTYVCRVADGSLYESTIGLGADEKQSWSSATLPDELDEELLCGVTDGATFTPLPYDTYTGSVEIPQ